MYDLPPVKPFVQFVKNKSFKSLAAIIKIPPKMIEDKYQDLPCSDTDRALIHELIMGMANNGKITLLFDLPLQDRLRGIGVAVEHVHPMKFLATIFSNGELKAAMGRVFEDYFKRTEFLDGLVPGMLRQHEKGKLLPFVADFAREVNVPENDLRPFFQSLNWEGLVRRLIGG